MEIDKSDEIPSVNPPPSKKIKLDVNEGANTTNDTGTVDKPISEPIKEDKHEISDTKKYPADGVDPSTVPNKKVKQDNTPISPSESAVKPAAVEKSSTKDDSIEECVSKIDEKSTISENKICNVSTEPGKINPKPATSTVETTPKTVVQTKANAGTEKSPDKKEMSSLPETKAPSSVVTRSPEVKDSMPKPPPNKVLKKLPGLNPIRPMSAPLHVSTDMAASGNRATISPVHMAPGRSPTSPSNSGMQMSPVRQMGGATLSPVPRMGPASRFPMRNTSRSPSPQSHRGGLTVSPVNQRGGLSISPVKNQTRNEVDISPVLSREVTISALAQKGVTLTPAQPQLSAEIRSQIPEGISITAIPSCAAKSPVGFATVTPVPKAKSPIRQTVPKPLSKMVSPPKPIVQQIRPQAQQIKKPVAVKTTRGAPPGGPRMNIAQNTPHQQPKPAEKKSPVSQQITKVVPTSEKPKVISPTKPNSKEEFPVLNVDSREEKQELPAPDTKPDHMLLSQPTQKETELTKKLDLINEEIKMEISDETESKKDNAEIKTAEKKSAENKENSSSDEDTDEDDGTGSESEEDKDAQTDKHTRSARKNKSDVTPARALRTRKSAAVDVAVKLTRIDDELEDGALPPWNIKKHLAGKSAQNSDVESANDASGSDDNSNSQGSQSAQSAPSGGGETKRRGRPRKTLTQEDYTGHESLQAALRKIIEDEGLSGGGAGGASESEEEEDPARRETKQLLSQIPFFSRRGGRGGVKGKAIGKNNQFDNRIVDRLDTDRKFRNEILKLYQEDVKKREEKKLEKMAENRKKVDERNKALAERKEKLKAKAEERRRRYEEQKQARAAEAKKRDEAKRLRASLAPPPGLEDDETRMSFPRTPTTPAWKTGGKLESLEDGDKSESKIKRAKMEVIDLESQKEFPVNAVAEYQWPLQGGEHFMIQEQVAAYLGVKSFKRKYPDLRRRGLEPEERTYICDSGLVSESMIELGLTAVQSADIMDIMFVDFPEKYEEVKKFMREKQARELIDRQRAFYDTTISEQTAKDLKETLVEATALWNAQFNRLRRETRQCSLDLQTFVVQVPARPNARPPPRIGNYPVAILPGQYCDYYKEYTPTELKYMPLNTVLYGPLLPNEPYADELSYSEASSQSDSDSDDSSSSGSSSNNNSSSSDSSGSSSDDEDAPKPLPQTPAPGRKQPGTPARGKTTSLATVTVESTYMPPAAPVALADPPVASAPLESSRNPGPESIKNCKACDRDETAGEMIRCGKCVRYLHPPCLDLPLDMLPHMKRYEWQCSDCKSCVSCEQTQDDDKMLFCDLCDRGYHNYCIGLDKIPTGRWHCKVCSVCCLCNSRDPDPEWEHEMKKGPKGQAIYQRTLCTPCAKSSSDSNTRSQRR